MTPVWVSLVAGLAGLAVGLTIIHLRTRPRKRRDDGLDEPGKMAT